MEDSYVSKVLIVGDSATGKTSIIKRYVDNAFTASHHATIGVDFKLKTLNINNKTINIQLWDIAGQDRFSGLARLYYRDAIGAVIVFDAHIGNYKSVTKWKNDIDSKLLLPNGKRIPILLVGNKFDLIEHNQDVENEIKAFAKDNDFVDFFYTSAKDGNNVKEAFNKLIKHIYTNILSTIPKTQEKNDNTISLSPEVNNYNDENTNNGCC